MMATALDIASWVLLTLGGISVLIGGIGALRLPDLFTRMHAASVTDSIGAILILFGIMLQAGLSLATIKLAAILLFLLLTSPTASISFGRCSEQVEDGVTHDLERALRRRLFAQLHGRVCGGAAALDAVAEIRVCDRPQHHGPESVGVPRGAHRPLSER